MSSMYGLLSYILKIFSHSVRVKCWWPFLDMLSMWGLKYNLKNLLAFSYFVRVRFVAIVWVQLYFAEPIALIYRAEPTCPSLRENITIVAKLFKNAFAVRLGKTGGAATPKKVSGQQKIRCASLFLVCWLLNVYRLSASAFSKIYSLLVE